MLDTRHDIQSLEPTVAMLQQQVRRLEEELYNSNYHWAVVVGQILAEDAPLHAFLQDPQQADVYRQGSLYYFREAERWRQRRDALRAAAD